MAFESGDYDKAIAELTEAIRLYPNSDGAYLMRGKTYFVKQDYDKAIADYTQAIRLEPDNEEYKKGLEIIQQRGKSSAVFPSGFVGTWKREGNYDDMLTFDNNSFKMLILNVSCTMILSGSSGDSYTFFSYYNSHFIRRINTITIKLVNGNIEISGESILDDILNGIWKKINVR